MGFTFFDGDVEVVKDGVLGLLLEENFWFLQKEF